jgi:hypothetical protein
MSVLILFFFKYCPIYKLQDSDRPAKNKRIVEIPIYRYVLIVHMIFMLIVSCCECIFMVLISQGSGDSMPLKDFWLANPYDSNDRKKAANELMVAVGLEWLIFLLFGMNLMSYRPQVYSLKEAIYWNHVFKNGFFVRVMNEVIEICVCTVALKNRSINAYSVCII